MSAAATSSIDTPSAHAAAVPPARRRRWPVVVVGVLALLVAGWVWGVPRLVAGTLVARLRAAGFADARVGQVDVAFDRVEVRELSFGNASLGSIEVPLAIASFRLGDLTGGQLDTLVLEQPVWTLAPAAAPRSAAEPAVPAGAPGERAPAGAAADGDREDAPPLRVLPELPLRRIELRRARVVADEGSALAGATLDATLTADDGRWTATAAGKLGAHALRASADLLVGAELASGDFQAALLGPKPLVVHGPLRVELVDGERVLDVDLRRREDPFDVVLGEQTLAGSGAIALRARVPFERLDAATIDLRIDELSLTASGLVLDRSSGHVVLTGLPRPVSDGPQVLRWQGLRFAKVAVGSGDARLELLPDLELAAHVRQRALDERGSVEIRGVRLAPGVSSVPATIAFDQVSLQEWLELLSKGRVTGDGRMTGTVEVVLHTVPRLDVDLQGGQVSAIEGGLVRFLEDADTKELIRQHAEQIAAASGHGNVVKDRIVGALEEFEYSALEFRIVREPDGAVTLQVHAAGQGRKVPQQLELDLNLHGFDDALDAALALKLGLDRARNRLDDRIDERIDAKESNDGPDGQRKR